MIQRYGGGDGFIQRLATQGEEDEKEFVGMDLTLLEASVELTKQQLQAQLSSDPKIVERHFRK